MGLLTDKENGLLNESSLAEARKAKVVYLDLDDIKQYEWVDVSKDRRKWNGGHFFKEDIRNWPEFNHA